MKKFFKEFKEFINRGNVMDMAVGIIIGGAFTSIVSSLVEDIINPFLGLFGGMNFDKLSWNILDEVTLNYGKFLTAVINFLIMALVVFLMVKALNTASEKLAHKEDKPAEKPAKKSVQCVKVRLPSMHAAVRCVPQSLMPRLCRSLKRKLEFNL